MNREYWKVLTKKEKRYFKIIDSLKYDSIKTSGYLLLFIFKLVFYMDIFVMVFFIFIRDYSTEINVPYVEMSKLILLQFKCIYWLMLFLGLAILIIIIGTEISKTYYIRKNKIHIKFLKVTMKREMKRLEGMK